MIAVSHHREGTRTSPVRTCIGCRERDEAGALVRVVCTPEEPPRVVPDLRRSAPGRGASLHARRRCFELAARRGGFARAFRAELHVDGAALAAEVADQYRRRIDGLLVSAFRAGDAVIGTDTVREAVRAGRVALLVVAADAEGRSGELTQSVERLGGRVVRGRDKGALGALFGRGEVAVVGVQTVRFADAIREAASRASALSEVE